MRIASLVGLLIIFIFAAEAFSQVPQTLSYQGVLTDADNHPRSGNFLLTFKLYEQAQGGEPIWQEVHTIIATNGLFNVVLGKTQPLSLPFDKPYWLGITVGGDGELLPRVELTAAAYSLSARSLADSALVAGSNIHLSRQGSSIVISATSGGSQLQLPFVGSVGSSIAAFSVANTGAGAAAQFQNNGAAATVAVTNEQANGDALRLQGNLTSTGAGQFAGGLRAEVHGSQAAINGLSLKSSQNEINAITPRLTPLLHPDATAQELVEAAIWGFTDRDSVPAAVFGQNDSPNSNITVGVWGFHRAAGAGVLATNAGTGSALVANHTGLSGNIAVFQSNFTNQARIDKTGKAFFNGGTQTGGADVAEAFAVEGLVEEYEPGDVLVISTASDRAVEKSDEPYSTRVIGVYAAKPGVLLSERGIEADHGDTIPVGVVGVIPTKVCGENGPIRRGDLLVTASTPGHAMKGTERERMLGAVIGKALEEFNGSGSGVVRVLVNVK